MEADPLHATPPTGLPPSRVRQQQQPPQREYPGRSPTLRQGRTPKDQKLRRTTPRPVGDSERARDAKREAAPPSRSATVKLYSPTVTQPKSLLPLAERSSQEDKPPYRKSTNAGHHDATLDITPDGGSAGREGRQFAVWNVGNNGRIYLRPTVRPPQQRYPQPQFVFPMTPPGTAGLGSLTKGTEREEDTSFLFPESQLTSAHLSSTPTTTYLSERDALPRLRHRRAMSDSTLPDTSIARESDVGGFKIVITQPGGEQRPRTVEDMDPTRSPLLEISIPSWKLGTPRFSVRGTPFLRGSSYAPTEDVRSSNASVLIRTPSELTPGLSTAKPSPLLLPHRHLDTVHLQTPRSQATPRLTPPFRSTYLSTNLRIEPGMFDALTFKPACDDRSIVRYSASTGAVTAATPPRLVAEITSPSFLDYDLLSDFFLTFRAFLDPSDLLRMLVARLRWALSQVDREIGTVVRVRTFVAVRHWILNYFMDDFVIDHSLRVAFCNLLNDFMDELSQDPDRNKAWLKILAELKRCWRRVCAQYWDGPEFDASIGPDKPISPGGLAGHRNPDLDPSFWEKVESRPPQLDGILVPSTTRDEGSLHGEVLRPGHMDATMTSERPATPENYESEALERNQTSPTSITSVDVISCSFPTKSMRLVQAGAQPLAAHPVDPSSVLPHTDPIATTPRALMGKRVRPHHKRNGSLSDSLREPASTTERLLYKNAEFLLTLPYAGSLVRGNLLPPGQAFVDVDPLGVAGGANRQTTVFEQSPTESQKLKLPASAMSGQGMRRLLGSVRRALSTKGETVSPTQGSFFNISPIGPRGATTNRLPGTAIVPQARPRTNGVRAPVRIDLLGAEIAEDFKRAVREDAAAEAEKQQGPQAQSLIVPKAADGGLDYSAAHIGSDLAFRPQSDMAITTGSKSIVIVDDTVSPDFPFMRGALPGSNASVETFAESFMPNMADPTPPNTPPGRPMGTPRRSSYILGQPVVRPSLSADPLPPFIPDMKTIGRGQSAIRPSQDTVRSSSDFVQLFPNRPPLSGRRGHLRHRSSRSLRSNRSLRHPRHASFTPGVIPEPTIRSFDATTYSEGSVDDMSDIPVPQPLRVLRRRPGGDLRAVTKVGDLDTGLLHKSRSVGSLSTFTDSIRSSYIRSAEPESSGFVDVASSDFSRDGGKPFSLGAIAEQNPKRGVSLFSTHSSKPIMRPSFEAEAQKLAQIPDDLDDDGGVEAALLKLEGKYEKKPVISFVEPRSMPAVRDEQPPTDETLNHTEVSKEEKLEHRHVQVEDEHLLAPPGPLPPTPGHGQSSLAIPPVQRSNEDGQSFLSDDSHGSYSSIPLLERGLTDDGQSRRTATQEWTNRSILQGPEEETPMPMERNPLDSQHPSYDFVKKTDSMERIVPGETMPALTDPRQSTEQSFLDVESDDDTDLSSEMSLEFIGSNEEDDIFPPLKQTAIVSTLPVNPLGENPPESKLQTGLPKRPPSPPMTLVQALQMAPSDMSKIPMVHEHQLWEEKPLPPTPDTTPTTVAAPYGVGLSSQNDPTGTREALRNAPKLDIPDPIQQNEPPRNKYSVHLPFILAFDSDVLAQQFTLVEKDALNEIDWKDLIDMKWKNAEHKGTNTRSWVSFLRDTDARGVEVVIARFNIMVKWAVSECVLTQDLEERARCIIKYIHIAGHCRRYRNYATASQLTIALTSPEVSRLMKTWALVPPSDIKTLRDLEALISPTRNFYNLRREMEGGGSAGAASTDIGCIPFVGIYTHDLLFNAQRPSEIASSPTTAPLVNFERCRMAAGVVKTLLRLLEASTNYTFQPIEGLTERCLWMGALSDEEIRKLADSLE
ncbi:hypothetical protein CONLIGDRAFT_580100 [Coniochaeta ligniaria NRRL 30616]|uniref:Ras GEF n=1 Tax=Coniochaeta ligniaria NRRL 30616 TaxID=1408157 RepID=A0A1J7J1M9_9PEZI|nr:hypothetical protein CONLIGDRAFT_580100 [Coniochaeta ligniaria NRRL 30616]